MCVGTPRQMFCCRSVKGTRELRNSANDSPGSKVEWDLCIHPTCFTAMRGIWFHGEFLVNWGAGTNQ